MNPRIRINIYPLATQSGVIVIILYCSFTLISWFLYPYSFTPWTHYLSRLGNFNYSPLGAYFYNLGCILTGIALFPFFIGLRNWYDSKKSVNILLLIGQMLGLFASIALIMIGIFSEDQGVPHLLASSLFFLTNFFVLIVINIVLLFHTNFIKAIGLYGLVLTILSFPLEIFLGGPLVEWYTVFGSLAFVGLLSFNTTMLKMPDSEGSEQD
ncbi:MAG: DUF998 domain-containing protein [Candidatus Thorarchaeota archaeon]|nr:DUF998 domain-containing protein [Candidatus Thorarchaeota archaeon]